MKRKIITATQTVCMVLALLSSHSAFAQNVATFNCSQAKASVEIAICQDNDLMKLDRSLADVIKYVSEKSTAAGKQHLRSYQQGWIKRRNDCWKSPQMKTCIKESYQSRTLELEIAGGFKPMATATFICNGDNTKPFKAAFYPDSDVVAAAQIEYMNDKAFVFAVPAASGARYATTDVEFWEHQGETAVKWHGNNLKCVPSAQPAAR